MAYADGMHLVRMFFIEMQGVYTVTFCQGNRQVGRRFRYTDGQRILEILREAHCPIEDHNLVENCLVERRPGSVQLKLTDAQHQRLIGARQ
jgi:hypothetical protein